MKEGVLLFLEKETVEESYKIKAFSNYRIMRKGTIFLFYHEINESNKFFLFLSMRKLLDHRCK
jgi:hypothetical protein